MAQILELPVEFKFEIEPVKYLRGAIRVRHWLHGCIDLAWTVSAPEEFAGLWSDVLRLSLTSLPPVLRHKLEKRRGERLTPAFKSVDIEAFLCTYPSGYNPEERPKPRAIDAWQLRDDFLHLKRSSQELLEFLNRFGKWDEGSRPTINSRHSFAPGFLLESDIWRRQEIVRAALKSDPGKWVQTHGFRLRARSTFPHFVHVSSDCFTAIINSITIDFLRRVPFGVCKRPDCGTPFAADRRGKEYCSQYCAHLASVRRGRRELKKRAAQGRNAEALRKLP